jgi:hypothetical protein
MSKASRFFHKLGKKMGRSFKKVGHWIVHHKKLLLGLAIVGSMFIPGVGGAVSNGISRIGTPLSKIPIGTLVKTGAIVGTGYVAYKGTKAVGQGVSHAFKSPLVWGGLGIAGFAYYKMKK